MRRGAPVLIAIAAILGCRSPIPSIDPASPAFARLAREDIATLEAGRAEYIRKCSGCHSLYRPSRGDAAYWDHWVEGMARRSRLSSGQEERIRRYLIALSGPE